MEVYIVVEIFGFSPLCLLIAILFPLKLHKHGLLSTPTKYLDNIHHTLFCGAGSHKRPVQFFEVIVLKKLQCGGLYC